MNARVLKTKHKLRAQRKKRIRGKISGTPERLRVSFFKSNRYLSAQAIDDTTGTTITAIHSKTANVPANIEGAKAMGASFAAQLKENGHTTIVFDRNGYLFHGVVASFANALRENEINL